MMGSLQSMIKSSDSYVHSGLTEGAYYHYKLTANTIAGETSDTTLGGDGTYHTTELTLHHPESLSLPLLLLFGKVESIEICYG